MVKKVIFVGNAKVGKTTVLRELMGFEQHTTYEPTLGVDVHKYNSPTGETFNIWDCAGDPRFMGLADGYYIEADIAFVFTGGVGKTKEQWRTEIMRVVPSATIHYINVPINEIRAILS